MIEPNINNEIKLLRYISIAHFIIIMTSIYLNIVGINEFYYTSKIFYSFVKYSLILVIITIIIPTSLLILPLFKNNLKILILMKYLILSFIILISIDGILKNISVWKSSVEAESFTIYCPYHYTVELIDSLYEKGNINSEICKKRSCFLYSMDESKPLGYSYLCNYDSSKDFEKKNVGKTYKKINRMGNEIISDLYIKCKKVKNVSSTDETFLNYINMCSKNAYYKCDLFEQPKSKDYTSFNNKESCPILSYGKTAFLLSVSILLIDIICFIFLLFIEFLILKKIIYIKECPPIEIKNDVQATINSTIKNNNDLQNDNNDNIGENNNYNTFKKESTETIIVADRTSNDDFFTTPRNEEEEAITKITMKNGKNIINLKNSNSSSKLYHLEESEKPEKINENKNEIKINNDHFNNNKRNRKVKITNPETLFQSSDSFSAQKGHINGGVKKSKFFSKTADASKEIQNQNQNENEDKNENEYDEDEKNQNTNVIVINNK